MIEVRTVICDIEKSNICNDTLRALPNWFGIEASIVDYVEQVKKMPFYAAYNNDTPIGFVAIKVHNAYTAEICIIVLSKDECEALCVERFKIPVVPPTTSKTIRFPNNMVEEVVKAITGKQCTFSAFVVEAVRVALASLKEPQE